MCWPSTIIMAAVLHTRGIVKAIMPVIVNEQEDGTHHEAFFQELLSGNVDGAPLPDVVSEKSMAKAVEFLALLPTEYGGPNDLTVEERSWTTKGIVKNFVLSSKVLSSTSRRFCCISLTRKATNAAHCFSCCSW